MEGGVPGRHDETFAHWVRAVALGAASRTGLADPRLVLATAKRYEEYLRSGRTEPR
jgi:hypothetical protein